MGLLDQLWDDTLAGPRPDSGLGRLRKHSSFAFRLSASAKDETASRVAAGGDGRSYGEDAAGEEAPPRVTRSIMIKRPPGWTSPGSGTPPPSPAGSTPPVSPFSSGGGKEWHRFSRRSMSDAYGRRGEAVGVEASTSSYPPFEV